ncbi:hypothetical protein L1049_027518 [Liquidambar formosana]|uniref:Uncharacterized protein n=1 Tax=Liquidambar formosana TaxID=63359 RepID=A0AAP0WV52_LIQFO
MEILTTPVYESLERYKRRRKYKKLKGVVTTKDEVKILRLEGSGRKPWKINVIPKLQLKITSPVKLLKGFRDAYVDMMLSFAGNVPRWNNGGSAFFVKAQEHSQRFTDLCFTGDWTIRNLRGGPGLNPPPPPLIPNEWQHTIPPEQALLLDFI